jgi:hypothetical protein
MKALLASLLASLMPTAALQTVTVGWTPQKDAVAFEVFRVMPGGPQVPLGFTLDSRITLEGLPDAGAVIVVRAVARRGKPDARGSITARSIPSAPFTIPKKR